VAITGVSQFPDLDQSQIDHVPPDPQELRDHALGRVKALRNPQDSLADLSAASNKTAGAVEAAMVGATLGQLAGALGFHGKTTCIKPLVARSLAEPFEELRDLSDAWQANHGRRPCVFLANMGPLSQHTGRANYSKNFFEVGGFEVIADGAFQEADAAALAFTESGASIGVICSSDKLYPKYVPDVASKLKAAGARTVVLAGKPGSNEEDWRSAGVDRFIFVSCDTLAILQEMLAEEGVLTSCH
jgi:methylmalonyl-CoA mutase